MNFIEKLEKYFNSGSTDKQNQRRLGGLLIAITAVLLVIAIIVTGIVGGVKLIGGIVDAAQQPDEPVDDGTNSHLMEVAPTDVTGSAKFTNIVLDGFVPENMTVSAFKDSARRPKKANGEAIYKCYDTQGLQTEAYEAFNKMISDFHTATNDAVVLWLEEAYDTKEGAVNGAYFVNALAVEIQYEHLAEDGTTKVYDPIYGSTECKWIVDNAYKYGFVRVSDAEGEDSVFRYVGLAHAKYIADKQKKVKADESFYGLDSYIAELRATTPDTEISSKNVKAIGQSTTVSYYAYCMTVAEGVTCKLPKNSYDYNIQKLSDTEYIVTYWKAAK